MVPASSSATRSCGSPTPVDVVRYVRCLEGMLIAVLADLGIEGAGRVAGRSGVWMRGTDKIAAIGIRVAQGVTMHGFALNCSNSFDAYRAIVACGLADAGVTSVSRELGRTVTPAEVIPLIERHFSPLVHDMVGASALDLSTVGASALDREGAPA